MRKIRVLIVDDSVTVRHVLWKVLREENTFEVVGMLANGREAVDRIGELRPDCVTLDIEMPVMNGLDALSSLRRVYPRLPVIVLSSLTQKGALASLEALSRGAADYVPKPEGLDSVELAFAYLRAELVPKIRALCAHTVGLESPDTERDIASSRKPVTASSRVRGNKRFELLVIGSSMGGPNALAALLPALGRDFPLPILIAQHMPPMFTALLAKRLSDDGPMQVEEAANGMALQAGRVLIAPGSAHLTVEDNGRGALQTHIISANIPGVMCKPSVDVLFESAAKVCRDATLAVVLSGMGNDGFQGSTMVHDVGGQVVVQDRETSVVWGMPGFVAQAGLANAVLPLNELGPALQRKALLGRVGGKFT